MKIRFIMVALATVLLVSCSTSKETAKSVLEPVSQSDAYSLYIANYCETAMEQMRMYGIPASITLAQGILESDAGRSSLAMGCNNHFGIKCHSDWNGGRTYKDDDARDECFRCYDSPEQSFEDHSLFLKNGSRYAGLFKLQASDYKGWARGLKEAGYATSSTYADKLVSLVERYNLDRFDTAGKVEKAGKQVARTAQRVISEVRLATMENNGCRCVRMESGMTLKTIAKAAGMSQIKLRIINEIPRKFSISDGTLVYIDTKKTRAEKEFRTYEVGPEDSLWLISQRYGVRMSSLARRNGIDKNSVLSVGQVLKLR